MIAATKLRTVRESARLLVVEPRRNVYRDARITDLPELLRPADLLVLNDAATIPASLPASTAAGQPLEIRLIQRRHNSEWVAVLFGRGDWRIPTESRPAPAPLAAGELLYIGANFEARIVEITDPANRLVVLRFNRDEEGMWTGIYAYGRPVQYSYMKDDLALWSVQTAYASRPWAAEMPSAGHPLSWSVLLGLKRRGIRIASLTHAAGLSALGPKELDARLPMPESFEIPLETVSAIAKAQDEGHRIVAVGTTVVRALEGCAASHEGRIVAGRGETALIIDETFRLSVVDALLTGLHDPAESHYRLLRAFSDEEPLRSALHYATAAGYRGHEFGDSCLIIH